MVYAQSCYSGTRGGDILEVFYAEGRELVALKVVETLGRYEGSDDAHFYNVRDGDW